MYKRQLLIAISVQSVGVFALIQAGLLTYEAGAFPWLGTVIGGYIFGLGIVLAGGCATGTWYRAGEGLIGSWIALFTYMVMSAVMRSPPVSYTHLDVYKRQALCGTRRQWFRR